MNRVIATEGVIKIEANQNITKKFAEKMEKFFNEAKRFVSDIDKDVTISLHDRTIVLGTMLAVAVSPEMISESCKILEDIMKKVNNFINDLPDEGQVATQVNEEKELDAEKTICDAFNSLKKAIPNAGVFIMVLDPDEAGVHLAGNLDKNFILTTLLMNG